MLAATGRGEGGRGGAGKRPAAARAGGVVRGGAVRGPASRQLRQPGILQSHPPVHSARKFSTVLGTVLP